MITGLWRIHTPHQLYRPGFHIFLVCPYFIGFQVGRVEVAFGGIEDHTVDTGVWEIGIVLDVFGEGAGWGDGEDVAVGGVVVEGITVDGVGRKASWEEEDCARVRC